MTISQERYHLQRLAGLSSPRLLVYRAEVEGNLERMREELEQVAPGTGFRHLRPHVKTAKSRWVVDRLLSLGVTAFKASPNELDLLLEAGAPEIFVAYPPLEHLARRLAEAQRRHPDCRLQTQASASEHLDWLESETARQDVELEVFLELDPGFGRTGTSLEKLEGLARDLAARPHLRLAGLHAYDGHNHAADPDERRALAEACMAEVATAWRTLVGEGHPLPRIVVAGSPPFIEDLETLIGAGLDARIEVSPGTWIYWDCVYEALLPGRFALAALLFARVMDRPREDRVTLDLGHKRFGVDQGPVTEFSVEGLRVVTMSEEHLVCETTGPARALRIGDPVLIAPRHVCPTVNCWEHVTFIGPDGSVEDDAQPVTARNR